MDKDKKKKVNKKKIKEENIKKNEKIEEEIEKRENDKKIKEEEIIEEDGKDKKVNEEDKEIKSNKKDLRTPSCCDIVENKPATEEQINKEKKILRNFLIVLGVFSGLVILFFFLLNSTKHVDYDKLDFKIVREGELIFYNIKLPVFEKQKDLLTGNVITGNKKVADYNFYLRNNPENLDKIPFNGEFGLPQLMVINMSGDFNCGGKGIIAIANIVNLYNFLEIKTIKDENATCDSQGRYMFLQIQEGDKTEINQVGPACYNLNINDCEILEGTERFMIETFVEFNKNL